MIEQAFFMGLASVWKPREWKTYCDDMHRLVENAGKNRNGNNTQAGAQLLSMFKSLGIPVASRATQTHGLNADGKQRR